MQNHVGAGHSVTTDLDSLTVAQSQLIDNVRVKYFGLTLRNQSELSFVSTLSFQNQYAHLLSRAYFEHFSKSRQPLRAIGEPEKLFSGFRATFMKGVHELGKEKDRALSTPVFAQSQGASARFAISVYAMKDRFVSEIERVRNGRGEWI